MNPVTGNLNKLRGFGHCLTRILTKNFSTKDLLKDLLLKMPKDTTHVPSLKEGRKVKKESASKYPAGTISLHVLGTGAKGAPHSLYVFTDQSRYLFNCGEGTQRLAHEHKMKLAKLEHIFVTNNTWDNIGGLPGVALTIQDIGVPEITLHGPPQVEKLFEGTKRFVVLKELKIKVADMSVHGYSDHIMDIDYIKLQPSIDDVGDKLSSSSEESQIEEDETDYYAPIKGCKRHLEITKEEDEHVKRTKIDTPEENENKGVVMCYVCRPKKKEGTLLIEKCLEFGVPAGPLLGKLKAGQDVTLPNGKTVKADDVRSPDCPGPAFIVVDCPHEKYIDSLEKNPILNTYHNPEEPENFPHVIVHFTPSRVMEHPSYKNWMEKFGLKTQHMLLNDSSVGMGSEAVHRIQNKLALLDKDMFPALQEDGIETFYAMPEDIGSARAVANTVRKLGEFNVPIIRGTPLLKYSLRPTAEIDRSPTFIINPAENVKEVFANEDFAPVLQSLKAKLQSLEDGSKDIYPEFIFLGTGSSIPNKTRNTSGILMHTDSENCILLDCGEGTYGQLVRFYGHKQADVVLSKMKAIYISHLHADHHIGLIQVLLKRQLALQDLSIPAHPVYLLAPHQIQTWLHLYNKCFERIKESYQLIPNMELRGSSSEALNESASELKKLLGLNEIQTAFVRHCPNAFGIAVVHSSGWKITYSGDTMPCESLVELGQNSDVLIHEATMDDELKKEAVMKLHSTTSEAIDIGNKMNAKFILLTHFSQRYAKVPIITENFGSNVGIAFDNMKVRKLDLPKIPLMYDALKAMFTEDYEEMEQRTSRLLRRRQLQAMTS